MNVLSIASTIAARFLPENVTPPSGYQDIRQASALIGSTLTPPSVLVFPPELAVTNFTGGTRTAVLSFPVRFYYTTPPAQPRDVTGLYRWSEVLLDQLVGNTQLGGSPVAQAYTAALRIAEFEYDGQPYDGVEMDVSVTVSEGVSPTA